MTMIRVDPSQLRASSSVMAALQGNAIGMSGDALSVTSGAPSYDGQFGPEVHAIGQEASSRLRSFASVLGARSDYLIAKADAFTAADQAVGVGLGILTIPPFPDPAKWLAELLGIPQWIVDIIISMVPCGDALDIIRQLWNGTRGEDVDDLVMVLAIFGLLLDLGYIDPIPAEEGGNALAGFLKAIAKQIPPGPVRDALAEMVEASLKNPDEAGSLAKALAKLAQRSDVFQSLLQKHPDLLVDLLKGGPDAIDALVKSSDDVILKYLDEAGDAAMGLGHSNLVQGLRVSELAQKYGIDLHLCGRLADTAAEQELRKILADEARQLAEKEGITWLEAQFRVAEKYGVNFFQVKASSVGALKDADLFIPADQWDELLKANPDAADEIRKAIGEIYGIDPKQVDFYQTLDSIDPVAQGWPPGRYDIPDPRTNVPPGAVRFGPDGAIEHPPILPADSPLRELIEKTWGLDIWP